MSTPVDPSKHTPLSLLREQHRQLREDLVRVQNQHGDAERLVAQRAFEVTLAQKALEQCDRAIDALRIQLEAEEAADAQRG